MTIYINLDIADRFSQSTTRYFHVTVTWGTTRLQKKWLFKRLLPTGDSNILAKPSLVYQLPTE